MKKILVPLSLAALLFAGDAYAWTEPGVTPPSGNVAAPITGSASSSTVPTFTSSGSLTGSTISSNGVSATANGNFFITSELFSGGQLAHFGYNTNTASAGSDINLVFGNYPSGTYQQFYWNGAIQGFRLTAPLTVAGDVNLTTGCFKLAGTCISSSQWTTSGSNIYNSNAGNVGIGLTTPQSKLHVLSSSQATGLRISGNASAVTSAGGLSLWDPQVSPDAGIIAFGDGTGWKFHIAKNSNAGATKFLTVVDTGNVGIGTVSPGAKLEVAGQVKITGGTPGAGKILTSDATGLATWQSPAATGVGGSGTTNYVPRFTPNGTTLGDSTLSSDGLSSTANGNFFVTNALNVSAAVTNQSGGYYYVPSTSGTTAFGMNAPGTAYMGVGPVLVSTGVSGIALGSSNSAMGTLTPYLTVTQNGNVGIGTTNPTSPLTVQGSANIGGTGNGSLLVRHIYGKDTVSANLGELYLNYGQNSNVYVGQNGGNAGLMVSGNVGIGTASPTAKLDVAGTANLGGTTNINGGSSSNWAALNVGTMPGNYGINSGGAIYSYTALCAGENTGNCTGTGGTVVNPTGVRFPDGTLQTSAATSGIGGSGSANFLPKFSGGTTLANSSFYDSGGNIGVGMTTPYPNARLDVVSPNSSQYGLVVRDSNAQNAITVGHTGSVAKIASDNFSGGSATPLTFNTNASERVRIDTSGNVGINTTNPGYKLDVNGGTAVRGDLYNLDSAHYSYESSSGKYLGFYTTGGVGKIWMTDNASSLALQPSGGNVGIGTSAPGYKLDVNGTARISASVITPQISINTTPSNFGINITGNGSGTFGIDINMLDVSGTGVRAITSAANSYGLFGQSISTGSRAVYGTASASGSYGVYGEGSGTSSYGVYCNASGSAKCGSNGKIWDTTSDERLKKNIKTVANGLEKVLKLRGVSFEWKDGRGIGTQLGFIAQETMGVLPEAVSMGQDGYYSMTYDSVLPVTVEAIKELNTKVDKLQSENNDLRARLEKLEAKLK